MSVAKNTKKAGTAAFPRGKKNVAAAEGGGKAVPNWHKSPAAANDQDATDLFSTGKKRSREHHNEPAEGHKKKKKKSKVGDKKGKKEKKPKASFAGVSALNPLHYADLSAGQLVLCVVSRVEAYQLRVSLPGRLVGRVPVNNISRGYTEQLRAVAQGADAATIRPLTDLFAVGQAWLATVEKVEHLTDEHKSGEFHRVTLSLCPNAVHAGLPSASLLQAGRNLQSAVKSVEDHGYVMDVGLADVRAFLPKAQAEAYVARACGGRPLTIGQLLPTSVVRAPRQGGAVQLALPSAPGKRAAIADPAGLSVHTLLPGTVCQGVVDASLANGMRVKVGDLVGYVHREHYPSHDCEEPDIGQTLRLHLLYVMPMVNTLHFSARSHLELGQAPKNPLPVFSPGQTVGGVEVVWSGPAGIKVKLNDDGAYGFVRGQQVSDQDPPSDMKAAFPVGSRQKCRIVEYDYADQLYVCSMKKSVLKQNLLNTEQLSPGDKVTGVLKCFVKSGAIVTLGKSTEALIPFLHLSDVTLKHPEKKYPVGSKLHCRVLKVEPERKSLHLTHKSILVEEDYPVVSTYDPANVGVVTEGVIVKVTSDGLLMQLFGDVVGWVPKMKISTEPIQYPEKLFFSGMVRKCKVIKVDQKKQELRLSLIIGGKDKPLGSRQKKRAAEFNLGEFYDCKVTKKDKDGLTVEIEQAESSKPSVEAFIPTHHLTDVPSLAESLLETYNEGDTISQALCFDRDVVPILTLKPVLLAATRSGLLPKSFEDLHLGMILPAVISNIKKYGVFVRLPTWDFRSQVLVPKRHLAEGHADADLAVHQTVAVKVVERLEEDQKITASMKSVQIPRDGDTEAITGFLHPTETLSACFSDFKRLCKSKLAKYHPGMLVTSRVVNVTDFGTEVNVSGVRGIITSAGLQNVADPVKKGGLLRAVVLFVEHQLGGCLELSAKPELVKKVALASEGKSKSPPAGTVVRAEIVLRKTDFDFVTLAVQHPPHHAGHFIHVPTKNHLSDLVGFGEDFNLGEVYNVNVKESSVGGAALGVVMNQVEVPTTPKPTRLSKPSKRERLAALKESVEDIVSKKTSPTKRSRQESGSSEPEAVAKKKRKVSPSSEAKEDANNGKEEASVEKQQDDPGWETDFNPWGNNDEAQNSESANETKETKSKSKTHLSKKEKKELDRLEAEEIARAEQRVLDGEEAEPETVDEFDRLVLASPSSSLCWIKYMAFHIQRAEYDKAREVARRALEKINPRDEDEKLNVYMARFNLENAFATEEDAENFLHKEALKYNDQYKVYQKAASIYASSGKPEAAEKLYKKMVQKYFREPEVWVLLGTHYFAQNNLKEARFTLQRSIQNLEKKHHVEMTSKFGQLEFKMGESERGKTIFETIVGNYPKRTDLWGVYVDMLVKAGELDGARAVFERMVQLNLLPKKMKAIFKKYVDFETKHGDQQRIDRIRKLALEYVNRLTKTGAAMDMGDD